MEALYVRRLGDEREMTEEEETEKNGEQNVGEMETSLVVSSTEEETDEDSEPEPPPVIRRKVSFADAFGLDLVSVKEFDNAEVAEPEASWSDGRKVVQSTEEIYLSCLFTVPSTTEELDKRLCEQMVELESIELLPGTATIRGIIRVVNLCYSKSVYARVTLDRWSSHFDLLAEYVPGSSDRKTDRFTFRYTVVPPLEKEGTRVEFCLRYETPMGIFWANNKGMNYVMFCHQKTQVKEYVTQTEEERSTNKGKRSCLKLNRNGDMEEKAKENKDTSMVAADTVVTHKVKKTCGETVSLHHEDPKPWVESAKSRRRAIRLARVQDYLCQRVQQQPKAFRHDSAHGQKVSQHISAVQHDSASYRYKPQKMQLSESPQVLTYHQIPLLTLDWNNHAPKQPGTAHANDVLTGRAKMTLSKQPKENTPSVKDMWEGFPKTTNDTSTKETSVSDVWKVFLNGPSFNHHSDVPESEWLQTAAAVLPSNDKVPQIQISEESTDFQEGTDTPTTVQTLAACQLLSDTCETLLAAVALNAKDDQPAEACVSSPEDDNAATQDTSQRSQTNSIKDTQEFNLKRAQPLAKETTDSPTVCHTHWDWEQESKGIIGTTGRGEGEPFILHTPDSVTGLGKLETTDMTVMSATLNASNVDRISLDARQSGGLYSSGEREVTGTAHNEVDDNLAFRETIGEEARDSVFSASMQGEKKEIMMNYTAEKVLREEEIIRPLNSIDMSLRHADTHTCEEFRLSQNKETDVFETGTRHADGFNSKQRYDENLEKSKDIYVDVKKYGTSNNEKIGDVGTQSKEREDVTEKSSKLMKILNGMQLKSEDRSSFLPMEEPNTQSRSVQVNENREDMPEGQKSETGQQELSYDRKVIQQNATSPSIGLNSTVDSVEVIVCQISCDTQTSFHVDRYDHSSLEVGKKRLMDPQQDAKSETHDSSSDKNPEEAMTTENGAKRDTSAENLSETSRGVKQDQSKENEKVCVGRLKIEAMRELMGNTESPQGENKNARKEQESPAEVKSSPHVEYNKVAKGTKDPITVENNAALEVTQLGMERMFIKNFGENLACRIWREVFSQEVQSPTSHTNTAVDVKSRPTDMTQEGCLIYEKNFNVTFDSDMFSLKEFSADSAESLCQGLDQNLGTEDNEYHPVDRPLPLTMTEHTNSHSQLQTDLDSIAHLSPEVHSEEAMFPPAKFPSSPKHQKNTSQVPHPKKDFETEGCIFSDTESFVRSSQFSNKHQGSSEKFNEKNTLLWWTILYTISHITRLLICTLLVGGFFVVVFLYDFPAFFALYIFSMSWWIFKWKRHQVMPGKKARK